jgi:hypothetical protein
LACLTAFVDVGFLSRIAGDSAKNAGGRIIFADADGALIGHFDPAMVSRQVNVSRVMPDNVSGSDQEPDIRFIRQSGRFFLQAGKRVRSSNIRHLPDWYVCYERDLGELTGKNQFIVTVSVILLAALGMYVLSCCVVRLF